MDSVFISIGSNRGNRAVICKEAISRMGGLKGTALVSQSSLYETEPVGLIAEGRFINCVAELSTCMSPAELLYGLKMIELELGRVKAKRWGPRLIDLDILFYGSDVIDKEGLCVPHREAENRAFVLIPMAEIAGDFVHPVLKRSITELASKVNGADGVIRYGEE